MTFKQTTREGDKKSKRESNVEKNSQKLFPQQKQKRKMVVLTRTQRNIKIEEEKGINKRRKMSENKVRERL